MKIKGLNMSGNNFTLKKSIQILDNVKIKFGVEKGGSLKTSEFKLIIALTVGKCHKYTYRQWIESLEEIDCIELNQNKTIVTILLDGDDLKWVK